MTMRAAIVAVIAALAVPALAIAQIGNVEMTAPTIGYVFDRESRGLRPLEGVPGAAILG
ncbi:MAG: hypothetical protein HY060_15960, partial [Proteobacteria bacterium]|nr:hypothetical protein [Pseudomonadota bacterium]